MRTIIAALAVLIGMGLSAYAKDPTPKVGEMAFVFGLRNSTACGSLDDLIRYHELNRGDDPVTASAFYRRHCTHIEGNTEVMVEERTPLKDAMCVRPRGQHECLWTDDYIYRSFDQEHPECNDWKTNKDLPADCYIR
jgi:hypothetical protein